MEKDGQWQPVAAVCLVGHISGKIDRRGIIRKEPSGEMAGLIDQAPFQQAFDATVTMHNFLVTDEAPTEDVLFVDGKLGTTPAAVALTDLGYPPLEDSFCLLEGVWFGFHVGDYEMHGVRLSLRRIE